MQSIAAGDAADENPESFAAQELDRSRRALTGDHTWCITRANQTHFHPINYQPPNLTTPCTMSISDHEGL
jgi:hypothetical protein